MPKFLTITHPAALALQQKAQAARRQGMRLLQQDAARPAQQGTLDPSPYPGIDFCGALDRVSVMLDKAQATPPDNSEEARLKRARAMRTTLIMMNGLTVSPFGRPIRTQLVMLRAILVIGVVRIRSEWSNWSLPRLVRTPLPALVWIRKPKNKRPGQHMSGPPLGLTFQPPVEHADQPVGYWNGAG